LFFRSAAKWFLIRPGEGRLVTYLAGLYLVIGLGMALGRSSSDALFFKRFGVEYLPHMFLLTGILLAVFSAIYAEYADRLRPGRLFRQLFLGFSGFLVVAWGLMRFDGSPYAFALYFLGYAVVSEILLIHFSLYAAGFLDTLQSKRLLPLINSGARLGAVLGGAALGLSGAWWPTEDMALAWMLALFAALAMIVFRHAGEPGAALAQPRRRRHTQSFAQIREGLRFARHSRLLQITGVAAFVMIVLVSVQDYLVSTILTGHFQDERALASFFGWFFAFTNIVVLLLQLLATNRLLRRLGLKLVNLIFPGSSIVSFAVLSVSATFVPALIGRFNYMGMLQAFRNPVANLFYSALPAPMQGRARALTTGLVLPLGLVTSGLLLVAVPKQAVGESLAVFGVLLSCVYLFLKIQKNRAYGESLIALIQQQVFSGKRADLDEIGHLDKAMTRRIADMLHQTTEETAILACAEMLTRGAPEEAGAILLNAAPAFSSRIQDRLLPQIAALHPPGWQDYARRCLDGGDNHLRATALELLTRAGEAPWSTVNAWLADALPRLCATAVKASLVHGDPRLVAIARRKLRQLLSSQRTDEAMAALSVVRSIADLDSLIPVLALTHTPAATVRASAITCLAALFPRLSGDSGKELSQAMEDPSPLVRTAAIQAARALPSARQRLTLLSRALQDPDFTVRKAALEHAGACLPTGAQEYQSALDDHFDQFRMQSIMCTHLAHNPLPGTEALLPALARRHLAKAYDKKTLALRVASDSAQARDERPTRQFLALVLHEEVQRHMDLVLEILENLDERQPVHAIKSALASRERRLRAQAVESIRHMENSALFRGLLPLLETEHDGAEWHHPLEPEPKSLAQILEWCQHEGSEWLKQCATWLAGAHEVGEPPVASDH
jgi:hypothetical protein